MESICIFNRDQRRQWEHIIASCVKTSATPRQDRCMLQSNRKKIVIIFFFSIRFLILNQNFICINSSNMYVLTRTLPVYKCIVCMFANEWFLFNFLKFLSSNSQVAPWFSLFGHREWEEKRWLFCQCTREEIPKSGEKDIKPRPSRTIHEVIKMNK